MQGQLQRNWIAAIQPRAKTDCQWYKLCKSYQQLQVASPSKWVADHMWNNLNLWLFTLVVSSLAPAHVTLRATTHLLQSFVKLPFVKNIYRVSAVSAKESGIESLSFENVWVKEQYLKNLRKISCLHLDIILWLPLNRQRYLISFVLGQVVNIHVTTTAYNGSHHEYVRTSFLLLKRITSSVHSCCGTIKTRSSDVSQI